MRQLLGVVADQVRSQTNEHGQQLAAFEAAFRGIASVLPCSLFDQRYNSVQGALLTSCHANQSASS